MGDDFLVPISVFPVIPRLKSLFGLPGEEDAWMLAITTIDIIDTTKQIHLTDQHLRRYRSTVKH